MQFSRYESSDVVSRPLGEAAGVTGRILRVRDFAGRKVEERWLFTKAYRRMSGRWRVLVIHASEAPQ